MAINPPSDIVLDVLQAADPTRAVAAAQRLSAIGSARGAQPADFATVLQQARDSATDSEPVLAAGDARARLAKTATTDKTARMSVEFEALILNNLVTEMLPKQADSVFGTGMAGDMWKSMLADQVSRQIAKSGTLGIGKRLFATHSLASHGRLGPLAAANDTGAAAAAQMSSNPLSMPASLDRSTGTSLFSGVKKS